jgi:uncharacterized protein (DUF885 family)
MLLLLTLPLLFGLAVVAAAVAPAASDSAFDGLLDADWRYWMTEYPELATQFGFPGQNGRWTNYSPEAIEARNTYLRASLDRLRAIDRATLNAGNQLNYDLYAELLETAVKGLAFHNDALPIRGVVPHNLLMPMNQLEGLPQEVPLAIALMPAATVSQYEDILARLEGVPALVDQTMALMRHGMAQGLTPPRITFRDVPNQVEAQMVADPAGSPLLAAFRAFPPSMGEADRVRLTRRAADAFTGKVLPAFTQLHEFLTAAYLPACRDATAVSALANGTAMYAYNVRWHTTTDETAEQIHAIGLAEVTRIRAEMDRVIAGSGFTGSFAEFAEFLRTDPQFYFTDAATLLTTYRDIAKRADPQLAPLFGKLPQTPYGIRQVPDATAPQQTTAYYQPGSFAAGRAGDMFANTYKLESRPTWEMEALTLHEAVPGHHLQIAIAQELDGLPEFRKNSSYTAFVEGWALYAESLGADMGFYADPYAKFGELTYEMWRAVRLVVDTGLHAMGWTRQQAIDYFAANIPKSPQDITVEVDRYIVWPGQALGYKMGQLKIRALRARAEQQLGPAFDIRRFHDVVLGQGAVPMDVLERRIDAWVASTAAAR